ncbi:ADP-ribosyltransferase domain-containing protein [Kibdelosporangium philippinense]|uniref:NAD(+)--protein-arginine ADP-ribosyltransferase n=2 Tax=Kibdelosporangium philippinense TaxID=211113 RepID=A0ABS8ZGT3_9PSEU|nr:ADP-ribosyltransferase domain-containing protein [Kibdelosporangium philippinense]
MWEQDAEKIDGIVAQHQQFKVVPRDQLIALRGHTAHHTFDTVNNALRTNDIQTLRHYDGYIRTVNSALNHLPPYQGLVSRVINTQHPALRASQYPMGAVITERGFLSTSQEGASKFPGKVELRIHSLTGRDIAPISHRPNEREVLFPSGTQFKVVGTGFDPNTGKHYIQLREIPPPPPPQRPMAPPQQQGGYAPGRQQIPMQSAQGPRQHQNIYNQPPQQRQQHPQVPQQQHPQYGRQPVPPQHPQQGQHPSQRPAQQHGQQPGQAPQQPGQQPTQAPQRAGQRPHQAQQLAGQQQTGQPNQAQQRPHTQQQPGQQPHTQQPPQAHRPIQQPPAQSTHDRAQTTTPLHRPHLEEAPTTQPLRQETRAPEQRTPAQDFTNRPDDAPSAQKLLDEILARPADRIPPKDVPVDLRRFPDDERLPHVAENIRHTQAGISLFDESEDKQRYTARTVERFPGHFVVDTHAKDGFVRSGGRPLSAEDVINIIEALPPGTWDRRTPLLFTGCRMGMAADGVAAQVARHFGVETVASRRDTWIDDHGNMYSAEVDAADTAASGFPRSKWPPNGQWARFTPDGMVHISENNPYPPGHTPDWGNDVPEKAPTSAAPRGIDDTTPRLTGDDVREYLDRPNVSEALDQAVGPEHKVKVDGVEQDIRDFVKQRLPQHPELVEAMQKADYLEKSLLSNPRTISSLLSHPDAIPILTDAVDEVHSRGAEQVERAYVQAGAATPTPLTAEQQQVSAAAKDATRVFKKAETYQLPMGDTPLDEYLDARYKDAAKAQPELNKIVKDLAQQLDGEPGFRPGPKDIHRSRAKILGDYAGDASLLTDLVGAKITFDSIENIYRAMDVIRSDNRLEIVKFKDRFDKPQASGYRDLQMSVRMAPNDHIAEFRLHLAALDDVSSWEHSLYEVTRDFEAVAKAEERDMTTHERALMAAVNMRLRVLFWNALNEVL